MIISGSPPNARIEKQYKSWILYLGLREISRDAPTMNMNNTSKNKISSLNNIHIPTGKQFNFDNLIMMLIYSLTILGVHYR